MYFYHSLLNLHFEFGCNIDHDLELFFPGSIGIYQCMDLVIVDIPKGLQIFRMSDLGIPSWIAKTWDPKNGMYKTIFAFIKRHLHDDGTLLIIQCQMSQHEFGSFMEKALMKVAYYWSCNQSMSFSHCHCTRFNVSIFVLFYKASLFYFILLCEHFCNYFLV